MKVIFFFAFVAGASPAFGITVGSKAFTEGYLLGELASQTLEAAGEGPVTRRFGLGNTGITFSALQEGEIDVYAEYTGTIAEAILKEPSAIEEMRARLRARGFVITEPLGFNNTYALAVAKEYARANSLKKISDLRGKNVRAAFSHEFVSREDGLQGLQKAYEMNFGGEARSLEHALAFRALADGQADLIDVYSTDAKIHSMDLVVLEDDRGFFPQYKAVFLARAEFVERHPRAWAALGKLAGTLDENTMQDLNSRVEGKGLSFKAAIGQYLRPGEDFSAGAGWPARIWRRTQEHALLVGVTVLLAALTGIPLGIAAARSKSAEHILLGIASIVQTVPSLALLCLLIPLFGIGRAPALVALYLYSLFPIVLNTQVGMRLIDRELLETAQSLRLGKLRTLIWIELPLAARAIVAGLKSATIIGIGTATLAALIGAGGFGALIVTGLAINDVPTILAGALPAAAMALMAHLFFIFIEKRFVE